MLWYAETGGRRASQLMADAAIVLWIAVWWRLARTTHDLVAALGSPGRSLAATGDRLGGGFRDVAAAVGDTPLIGGVLQSPFSELAGAADAITGVGTAQDAAAASLADWTGALVLLVPVLTVGLVWLVVRLRGARRAGAARQLRAAGADDLLALRALTTQPLAALLAVSTTPVADWQRGEVHDLAALELRRVGLRGRASTGLRGRASTGLRGHT